MMDANAIFQKVFCFLSLQFKKKKMYHIKKKKTIYLLYIIICYEERHTPYT